MKIAKRAISVILCALFLISSAPILNLDSFKTNAVAVSYAKAHQREYYYAPGTQFVTFLAVGSNKKGDSARSALSQQNYTIVDKDLNSGAGGNFVYLGYSTDNDPLNSIRDLRIYINKGNMTDYLSPNNGFSYRVVGLYPISHIDNAASGAADLNGGISSADFLHYFATKEINAGDPIVAITVNNSSNDSGFETVKYLNQNQFDYVADANRDAGGQDIFTHLQRLPQVNTTDLRAAIARADTFISNSSLYTDVSALIQAKSDAKMIIDEFDNYQSTTEAYSTNYNQVAIDNARAAIEAAISTLQTKLNWADFNAAVSNATGLNKDNYVDFSAVDNAVNSALLIKNSLSTQAAVDSETAKINNAVASLVPATKSSSLIQANITAESIFQASVQLKINNVYSGTHCDYWTASAPDVSTQNNSGINIYYKTAQHTQDKWNASKATIYVDPDKTTDLFSTGVSIEFNIPWLSSIAVHKARWGVQLSSYQNNYTLGVLTNVFNSVTVPSQLGESLTYTLCDSNGATAASALSANGDFHADQTITDGAFGPYTLRLKGAVPKAGDRATVRVLGVCASWAYNDNIQLLTEHTDLTIISVSKTALKAAIYTPVCDESVYTSASYASYLSALNTAKEILNKQNAEQSEVDAATLSLNNAINSLQTVFDMTDLFALRDSAAALNSASYENFSDVQLLIDGISTTHFSSQQQVDEYTHSLELAILSLCKKGFTQGNATIKTDHRTVFPDVARINTSITATKANFVTSDDYSDRNGETGQNITYSNQSAANNASGGQDYHIVYQSDSDETSKAYYVFDKYNNTNSNINNLGDIINASFSGEGRIHHHSLSLFSEGYNQSNYTHFSIPAITAQVNGSNSGKAYSYTLVGGGTVKDWTNDNIVTSSVNASINGPIPDAGDTVCLKVAYRNIVGSYVNSDAFFYYGWVTLNFVSVDSTQLRNAIKRSSGLLTKDAYTASSYQAYLNALESATQTLNTDSLPSQAQYDQRTQALNNAIDNLEVAHTVTFDSQGATTQGSASVEAIVGQAMPSITPPTRESYFFDGYYAQPNGAGEKYYDLNGLSVKSFDAQTDIILYANWIEIPAELVGVKYSVSLNLARSIDINFKISGGNLTDEHLAMLQVLVDGSPVSLTSAEDKNTGLYATATIASKEAKEIADDTNIKVIYNGATIKELDYSVLDYCKAVIEKEQYSGTSIADLCYALINYGKCAADYFKDPSKAALDAILTSEFLSIMNTELSVFNNSFSTLEGETQVVTNESDNVQAGLSIGSTTTMKFIITTANAISVNNIVIKNNLGEVVDPALIDLTQSGDEYTLTVNNITANTLSRRYTITINGVSESDFKVVFGPYDYLKALEGSASESDSLKALAKAIYVYGQAAAAYNAAK